MLRSSRRLSTLFLFARGEVSRRAGSWPGHSLAAGVSEQAGKSRTCGAPGGFMTVYVCNYLGNHQEQLCAVKQQRKRETCTVQYSTVQYWTTRVMFPCIFLLCFSLAWGRHGHLRTMSTRFPIPPSHATAPQHHDPACVHRFDEAARALLYPMSHLSRFISHCDSLR